MYFSTALASQTLMSVNQLWRTYNELNSVLSGVIIYFGGGVDPLTEMIYGEEERKQHLIRCLAMLEEEVQKLSQLYPAEDLQNEFRGTIVDIEETRLLLSESDLKESVYVPGVSDHVHDWLQSRIANFGFSSLTFAIADHIQKTTPLSGHQAKLVTTALVSQNPQAAIQQMFTLFEDHLRKRIGASPDLYGESLINAAFGKDGALQYGETAAEQVGVRNLFSGVYGVFRNPRMHRRVDDEHSTVIAILTTVDLLIKIIDQSKTMKPM